VAGYTFDLDPASRPSTIMAFGTYSDTDSWFAGLFGDVHWGEGRHQLTTGLVQGTIRNEYEDFLGTGLKVKTTMISRHCSCATSSVYTATGFSAASSSHRTTRSVPMASWGISSSRSAWWASIPTASARSWSTTAATACAVPPGVSASSFTTSPAARVSGGDESFDSVSADYTRYLPFGDGNILALQVHGRWTDDAPLGG
jgi:hypothetical protein